MYGSSRPAHPEAVSQEGKRKVPSNYALPYLHLASAGISGGSYQVAENSLEHAIPIMQRIKEDSGKNIAATFLQESKRMYKGDPYEKAMANFYLGLLRYYDGDYDRALANFRNSEVADMETNSEKDSDLNDFAIGSLFAAKSYYLLGEKDNALAQMQKALPGVYDVAGFKARLENQFLEDNFTLVIENGMGPYKMSVGMGKAAIDVKRGFNPVTAIRVLINGEVQGPAIPITDVYEQALQHDPSGGRRALQAVKGLVDGVVGVVGFSVPSKSDARSWVLLPNDIYLFSTTLPAGLYTITLQAYGAKGKPLPRYDQTWYYIPVMDSRKDNLLVLRTGYDKTNMALKKSVMRSFPPEKQKEMMKWR